MAIVSNTCIQYHYRTFARVIYHAITVTAPPAWCSWVGKRETEVVIGEARVQTTDWFVYLCPWLYTICQALETFLDYCGRKQQKAMLTNKGNSCSSLYVQLTVRIHLTIDNTIVRSILSRWVKFKWGQRGASPKLRGPVPYFLASPWSHHCATISSLQVVCLVVREDLDSSSVFYSTEGVFYVCYSDVSKTI